MSILRVYWLAVNGRDCGYMRRGATKALGADIRSDFFVRYEPVTFDVNHAVHAIVLGRAGAGRRLRCCGGHHNGGRLYHGPKYWYSFAFRVLILPTEIFRRTPSSQRAVSRRWAFR